MDALLDYDHPPCGLVIQSREKGLLLISIEI
jgi:hypothetical protein